MTPLLTIPLRLALVSLVSLAPPVLGAQSGALQFVGQEGFLWTGEYESETGKGRVPVENIRGNFLKQVDEVLARVQILREVDRDFEQAAEELRQAWLFANLSREEKNRIEGLVRIATARASLLLELGRVEEAREAAGALLLRPDLAAIVGMGLVLEPASEELSNTEKMALFDLRLVAVREEIERALGSPRDDLENQVIEAVNVGDARFVQELGARAVPTLMRMTLDQPDWLPAVQQDSLYHLVGIAEIQAARTVRDNLDRGGFLWRKRVLRAMNNQDVLDNPGTWADSAQEFEPPHCLEPEWLEILAALLPDPDVGRDCLPLVREAVIRDAVTPRLQAALGDALLSDDADLVREVMEALDVSYRLSSIAPVLDRAIASPREHVRRFAADRLSQFADSPGLRSRAGDSDPQVRAALARSLRRSEYSRPSWQGGNYRGSSRWTTNPVLDENARLLLARLIGDEEVSVRREAARSISLLPDPLSREAYERMLDDPEPEVRSQVLALGLGSAPFYGELLARLARDPSGWVRDSVDRQLEEHSWSDSSAPLLPALLIRAEAVSGSAQNRAMQGAIRTPAGLIAITPWALERDDEWALGEIVMSLASQDFGTPQRNGRLELLSDELLARLFVRAARLESRHFQQLFSVCTFADPNPFGALHLVMSDEDAAVSTRLSAASIAASGGGEAFSDAVLQLVASPRWDERPLTNNERQVLEDLAENTPPRWRNALLLRVVRASGTPDEVAQILAAEYRRDEPLGREISLAALKRWFAPGGPAVDAVRSAILHLGALPEDADPEFLQRAAREPAYTRAAVEAMGLLRSPELLPTLGECLRAEWHQGEVRASVQMDAARAIGGYLSEDAAQLLLQGLGWASSDTVRNVCFAGLATIRQYIEEVQRWEEDAAELPTPESAKRRLFEMLRDEDPMVRGQAARGLAAFGALEAIPDLIVLLKDGDESVRVAAQEALARLQEAE